MCRNGYSVSVNQMQSMNRLPGVVLCIMPGPAWAAWAWLLVLLGGVPLGCWLRGSGWQVPPSPPTPAPPPHLGGSGKSGGGSPGGYRGITTPTKHPGNRFNLRVVESSTSDTAREQSRINSQHSPHMGAIWPCSSDGKSVSPIMKMSPVRVRPRPQYAIIAQLAERLICNQQVVGSSPTGSSTRLSCGLASISLRPRVCIHPAPGGVLTGGRRKQGVGDQKWETRKFQRLRR